MKHSGLILVQHYASDKFRKDKEDVVLEAVKQDGEALQWYASKKVREQGEDESGKEMIRSVPHALKCVK